MSYKAYINNKCNGNKHISDHKCAGCTNYLHESNSCKLPFFEIGKLGDTIFTPGDEF